MTLQFKISSVFSFLALVIIVVIAAGVQNSQTISNRFDQFSEHATELLLNLADMRETFQQVDNKVLQHYLARSTHQQNGLEQQLKQDDTNLQQLTRKLVKKAELLFANNDMQLTDVQPDLNAQQALILINRQALALDLQLQNKQADFLKQWQQVNELVELKLKDLNSQSFIWLSSLMAIKDGLDRIRALTEMVAVTKDPDVYPTLIPTASDSMKTLKTNLEILAYQSMFSVSDLVQVVDKMERSLLAQEGMLPIAVSYLTARDKQVEQLEQYRQVWQMDLTKIDKFADWINQQTSQNALQSKQQNASATQWLIIAGVISVIVTAIISFIMVMGIRRPIKRLTKFSQKVSRGDLTENISKTSSDEFGTIGKMLNSISEHLNALVVEVIHTSQSVNSASDNLLSNNQRSLDRVFKISSDIETLSAALQELGTSAVHIEERTINTQKEVDNIDRLIMQSRDLSKQNADKLAELGTQMKDASNIVRSLRQSSEDISSIVAIIRAVAEQTNLLALNAAIEAARAGENGRGFAVVADEVRELAARTQKSTEEIESIVSRLQSESQNAESMVDAGAEITLARISDANNLSKDMRSIGDAASIIKDMSASISTSATEQGAVIQEIAQNIVDLAEQINDNKAEFNDNVKQTEDLVERAHTLRGLTAKFTTR
ncbi:chemotaxis sensory transducer protein [Catenovulum agarivorans DS-2]|uniref:Chemotaxis sensory transducer protein n=1 Tax=Catenovulum agarivorans DS-2 TaxID=1328313 RepID=W7R2Q6_9ALTE|nr:methyl-accepting chemotaxis protein [Catenovulum agarivorans]EWH11910.1 chemotaxis sensory transducer protein [Catenovulum agarivorans DS-2]